MQSDSFRIRASATGKIMTNAKSKAEILGATCKTYLEDWAKEQLTGKHVDTITKYTTKGIIMEREAIDMVTSVLKKGLLNKNTKSLQDDEITGTPDLILSDMIIDVKCSWDLSTFPMFKTEVPNTEYYWQAQSYMALTGKASYKLAYALMDTPAHLIEAECNKYCYHFGYAWSEERLEDFTEQMTYKDVDEKLRTKIFDIPRDDEAIAKIRERVHECRKYLKTILN